MKVLERKFKSKKTEQSWRSKEGLSLCYHEFGKLFSVPKSVKTIWMSLHDRPAKDQVIVKIVPHPTLPRLPDFKYEEPGIASGEITNMAFHFDGKLKKLIGKTFYLQCEHE